MEIADGPEAARAEAESPLPDALSSADVAARAFSVVRRGYDRDEVRAYLTEVASALDAAYGRVGHLERQMVREVVTDEAVEPPNAAELLEAVAAEAWRDEVLADLDQRRRELNGEVMRLRAGRDRLRDDLGEVAEELTRQLRRLDGVLQAARAAGDSAAARAQDDEPRGSAEAAAELEVARLAGFANVARREAPPGHDVGASTGEGALETTATGSLADGAATDAGHRGGASEDAAVARADEEPAELFARLRAERSAGARRPSAR